MLVLLLVNSARALTCSPVVCESFETVTSECLQTGSSYYIQECTDSEYTCPHPSNAAAGTNLECEYWTDARIWEADSWEEFYQYSIADENDVCDPYGLVSVCDEDLVCPPVLHHDLAERTPGAELAVIPRAGHLSTIDQPAAVSDLLVGWLDRISHEIHTQEGNHAHQHA